MSEETAYLVMHLTFKLMDEARYREVVEKLEEWRRANADTENVDTAIRIVNILREEWEKNS